jgi:GAF domain-containing protein
MFLEAETNLRESQQINQRLTGQAWKDYMRQRVMNSLGYTLSDGRLHAESAWTPLLEKVVTDRRPITTQGDNKHLIAVPVELRGQVIGAIEVEFEGNLQNVGSSTETIDMIQAVAQRLAVSVDNARLFEQTQELAQQEFEVNSISAKIQGVTDIQDLIKIALHELSSAIDADAASIRLGQLSVEAEA